MIMSRGGGGLKHDHLKKDFFLAASLTLCIFYGRIPFNDLVIASAHRS